MIRTFNISAQRACRVVRLNRSTYYLKSTAKDQTPLIATGRVRWAEIMSENQNDPILLLVPQMRALLNRIDDVLKDPRGRRFRSSAMLDTVSAFRQVSTRPDQAHRGFLYGYSAESIAAFLARSEHRTSYRAEPWRRPERKRRRVRAGKAAA
jgi:hypothetical protein